MKLRQLLLALLFITVFGTGMINSMTNGHLVHLLASQMPGHIADGNVSIEEVDEVTIKPGETVLQTVKVENAKRISYIPPDNKQDKDAPNMNISFSPPPLGVEQSYPPNYIYNHAEKHVQIILEIKAGETLKPGNWTLKLTAKPGNIDSRETVREIPLQVR